MQAKKREEKSREGFDLHDIAFFQLEIAAGVDDDVRERTPLLRNVVVVDRVDGETVHARADQTGDFGPLDQLTVVIARLVTQLSLKSSSLR